MPGPRSEYWKKQGGVAKAFQEGAQGARRNRMMESFVTSAVGSLMKRGLSEYDRSRKVKSSAEAMGMINPDLSQTDREKLANALVDNPGFETLFSQQQSEKAAENRFTRGEEAENTRYGLTTARSQQEFENRRQLDVDQNKHLLDIMDRNRAQDVADRNYTQGSLEDQRARRMREAKTEEIKQQAAQLELSMMTLKFDAANETVELDVDALIKEGYDKNLSESIRGKPIPFDKGMAIIESHRLRGITKELQSKHDADNARAEEATRYRQQSLNLRIAKGQLDRLKFLGAQTDVMRQWWKDSQFLFPENVRERVNKGQLGEAEIMFNAHYDLMKSVEGLQMGGGQQVFKDPKMFDKGGQGGSSDFQLRVGTTAPGTASPEAQEAVRQAIGG